MSDAYTDAKQKNTKWDNIEEDLEKCQESIESAIDSLQWLLDEIKETKDSPTNRQVEILKNFYSGSMKQVERIVEILIRIKMEIAARKNN
ncbi:MAG: hypothetical protein ACOX6Q_00100 [Candidatus Dojkabacteria bacterium]|jgi:hypothetical protein